LTDETSAPAGGDDTTLVATAPADTPSELTAEAAARALAEIRWKRNNPEKAPAAENPEAVETPEQLPDEGNGDPETDPAEEPEAAEPEEDLPPIEPPRSWTKAEKERFASLPRETQEYLHTREQERDREFRRSQNELADQRKAIQAEREAAEKARQQYEANLPALMQELQNAQQSSFADIKSMEDVARMQAEDPFRFQAWQVQQMKLQAVNAEVERAESEKARSEQSKWAKHVQEENAKAAEFIPDLADKDKAEKLTSRVARELLPDLGFAESELNELAAGKSKLSIYDHRVQRLLADSLKLRDILSAPKAVAAKPVPPVQRPGTAAPKGSQSSERIQALQKTFERDPSVENATALRLARLKRA
jgi:Predicted membrane protein